MTRARKILWLLVAAAAFALVVGLVLVRTGEVNAPTGRTLSPGRIGIPPRPAPNFTLRTFEGGTLSLSEFRGKVVVLNFWASWCAPCRQEMPILQRVWTEFRARGVVVLGVDVLDDVEDAAAFLKALKITYPNAHDPGQGRMNAYQVTGLPTTFFIDQNGRIRSRVSGGYLDERGYQELREQILALLTASP